MRKLFLPLAAFLLLAASARADVSGKWSGTAELQTPDGLMSLPISAEFKQQEKTVRGTIGKQGEEQFPIEKGALDNGKLTFEFTAPEEEEASGHRTYTMRLNSTGDAQLQGEFDFVTNGQKVTGKITLARAK